jgi:hypothetical protein
MINGGVHVGADCFFTAQYGRGYVWGLSAKWEKLFLWLFCLDLSGRFIAYCWSPMNLHVISQTCVASVYIPQQQ